MSNLRETAVPWSVMSKYVLSFVCLVVVCLVPSTASARSLITSPAGCNQTFKDKSSKAACNACIKSGSRYKKSARGGWSCVGKSGGSGGGDMSGMKKSEAIRITPKTLPPKQLSKYFKEYVTIPAGTFTIGSPADEADRSGNEVQAQVTITRSFLMKSTEVTNNEWHFIMGTGYEGTCGLNCPVAGITFREMLEYLNKISVREKLEPCYDLSGKLAKWTKGLDCTGYRLPTEAEWEYAARAGVTGARYGEPDDIAWHDGNSSLTSSWSDASAHQVAQKKPNAWKLFDMIGNVSELTWDAFEYYAFKDKMTDPVIGGLAQESETKPRTLRGGGWKGRAQHLRAAYREGFDYKGSDVGFRPVRTKK